MSFLPCGTKHKKKYQKFGLVELFRQKIKPKNVQDSTNSSVGSKKELLKPRGVAQHQKLNKFVNELAQQKVSYQQIQKLAWDGVPNCLRPKIWKYLLKYALIQATEETLNKKRQEYQTLVKNYWKPKEQLSEDDKKVYHTIEGDVKRVGTQFNDVFKAPQIQNLLKRMLYVWHMRHPASGYVQGMCDITNPFLTVFLSEYLPLDLVKMEFQIPIQNLSVDTLFAIQADCYWCVSKMLQYVVKNYTHGFGGQHEAYSKVQQLLYKIDEELYSHLMKQKIDLFALSFRCISTMLLRMFDPLVGIRLFDTFIAYEEEYPTLMIYLIIAILEKFAKNMLKMRGDQLMGYLQKLPTKNWEENDVEIVIAQAYVYKKIFG